MKFQSIYLSILVVLAVSSCKKPDEFPIEPIITFKDISSSRNALGFDEKVTINLSFTDGDGDVGYKDNGQNDAIFDDPTSQYYRNYQATLFQFINGAWVERPSITGFGGRLPYLTPTVKNKSLKGDISCDIFLSSLAAEDTFRFDVFIYDRSLHKSNIVSTSAIFLNIQ